MTNHELVLRWRAIATRKFKDAESELNPMGKRLIEHGAMCYFNCAEELMAVIQSTNVPSGTDATEVPQAGP